MNRVMWLFLLLCSLTVASPANAAQESLRIENQLLETELGVAEAPRIYFLFNFKDSKIYFKARGRVLRELPIKGIRVWGRIPSVAATVLVGKSTLFPPKRVQIQPANAPKDGDDVRIEALDLKDMPVTFTLEMKDKSSITIRPEATGMMSWLWSARHPVAWYLTRPVLTVWHTARREPFRSIELVIEEADARALYWSFLDGMTAIVFSPGGRP